METVEANGTDGKNGKVLRKSENFIEDYGFTNTLDISVGAMLLYYRKDLKPEERQEAIQSIVIPTATTATPTATPTAGGGGSINGSVTDDASIDYQMERKTMEMTTCENSNDNSEKCLDSCCENDVTRFTGTVEWSGEWSGLFSEIKAKIDRIKLAKLIDTARDYVKTKIG